MQFASLNMEFEVKDLVKTIEFYNILFGEQTAELYPGHAIYTMPDLSMVMRFVQKPATEQRAVGNFSMQLKSDDDVYERFNSFAASGFSSKLKVDRQVFSHQNHAFGITDPNGLFWNISVKEIHQQSFKLFNIPRMNSMWDILRPL